MGISGTTKTFPDFDARREELIRLNFEPQLARLGLSMQQIETQSLDELNQSLLKVNEAISHPGSFGTLKLALSANAAMIIVNARQEAVMEVGILPLLLERKSLILSRLKTLAGERRVESLRDLVATVADPQLRAKIEREVTGFAEQARQIAEQESVVAQAQAEQIEKRDEALANLRAELFERRLRAWTGFLAKESMATYVGAFLLVVLTLVQVTAMFLGAGYKSEIISNAFLLLLGYFFGQGTERSRRADRDSGG